MILKTKSGELLIRWERREMKNKKILILSSGGDAPGMNAAIRAAVRTALYYQLEIYGCEMGYTGLMQKRIFPMAAESVANCIQRGGTLLKTGRTEEFKREEIQHECYRFIKSKNIDALIILGGDGSFAGAAALAKYGDLQVIGIPCTIDNDIVGTEYCIGFDTAKNTALDAIDKIRDTAFSLDRNFLIEVMGRASGFLAVDVGIAGGAEFILIPEYPMTTEDLVKEIKSKQRPKLSSIIVAAEAGHPGHSLQLAEDIRKMSGIIYKVAILGHIQRGGSPTLYDRKIASIMGAKAIEGILAGHTKKMIAVIDGKLALQDFPDPKKGTRFFDNYELLKINKIICQI
jgi:6-phosphofructokinase 1